MIADWNGNIVMCKLISSPTILYNVEQDLIDNNLYGEG